jgi:hypothetical protein
MLYELHFANMPRNVHKKRPYNRVDHKLPRILLAIISTWPNIREFFYCARAMSPNYLTRFLFRDSTQCYRSRFIQRISSNLNDRDVSNVKIPSSYLLMHSRCIKISSTIIRYALSTCVGFNALYNRRVYLAR